MAGLRCHAKMFDNGTTSLNIATSGKKKFLGSKKNCIGFFFFFLLSNFFLMIRDLGLRDFGEMDKRFRDLGMRIKGFRNLG